MSMRAPTSAYQAAWEQWNYGGGGMRGEPQPRPEDFPDSGYGGTVSANPAGPGGVRPQATTNGGYYDANGMPAGAAPVYAGPDRPSGNRGYNDPNYARNMQAGYDVGAWNSLSPQQQAQYQRGGGAPQQQGGGSIEDRFRQAGPADGDPAYWASVYNEKVGKGADPQATFDYLTGRADFKTLGGTGGPSQFGGGMGNYSPIGPMNYGERASWSGYNAPDYASQTPYTAGQQFSHSAVGTPQPFQQSQIQGPTPFGFPGVYQQPQQQAPQQSYGQMARGQQPQQQWQMQQPPPQQAAPQQPAAPAAPAVNPHGVEENGMVRLTNGAMVPKDHPMAAEYNAWQPPAAQSAPTPEMVGDRPMVKGQSSGFGGGPQMGTGLWSPEDQARSQGGGAPAQEPTRGGMPSGMRWNDFSQQMEPIGSGGSGSVINNVNPNAPDYVDTGWNGGGQAQGTNLNAGAPATTMGQQLAGTNLQPGQLDAAGLTMPLYQGPAGEAPGTFGYNSTPQSYQEGQQFAYGQTPGSYTAGAPIGGFSARGQINAPTPFSAQGLQTPGQYQGQDAFGYGQAVPTPEGYTPGTFKPPTEAELKEDPSYQFRVKEAMGRLENAAASKGILRSGQTWDALQRQAEEMASQEYAANYGRRFNEFQRGESDRAQAYNMNTQTGLQAQQQGYGQAAGTYGMNEANRLGAYQTNAQTQMAAQGQQYGQAANTYGMNAANDMQAQQASYGNMLAGYQADVNTQGMNEQQRMAAFQANQAAQAQGYGQAANTQQMNEQQRLAGYQANLAAQGQGYGQAADTYSRNLAGWQAENQNAQAEYGLNAQTQLGAQGQAYGQAFQQNQANFENQFNVDQANQQNAQAAYGLNAQTQLGYQGQQYNQAYNTWQGNQQQAANAWQMNAGQRLNEYQAQAGAGQAAAALNLQGEMGTWDRNYQSALNDYNSQVQQAQFGQNAYQFGQNYGLQQNSQNFNQGLATDQWNYQTQYSDPWNRAYQTASLGFGGAQGAANAGQNSANALTDLYGTGASAYGAGQVGSANAWSNAFQNIGNTAAGSAMYYGYNQPQSQPTPRALGSQYTQPFNSSRPGSTTLQNRPPQFNGYGYTEPGSGSNG